MPRPARWSLSSERCAHVMLEMRLEQRRTCSTCRGAAGGPSVTLPKFFVDEGFREVRRVGYVSLVGCVALGACPGCQRCGLSPRELSLLLRRLGRPGRGRGALRFSDREIAEARSFLRADSAMRRGGACVMRLPNDAQRDVLLGCERKVGAPVRLDAVHLILRGRQCVRRGWLLEGVVELGSRGREVAATFQLTHAGLAVLEALARAPARARPWKACSCGKALSLADWSALPLVGVVEGVEMRNCPTCGSTLGIELSPAVPS